MGEYYHTFLHGDAEKNTKWRFGALPNYDVVNKLFEEGRTKVWPQGSMEEKVHSPKELGNGTFPQGISQLVPINGPREMYFQPKWKPVTYEDFIKLGGGYNSLQQTYVPDKFKLYNLDEETTESTYKDFTTAFPRGFIVQAYSGPPVIVLKFRLWGYMEGPCKGCAPTGEEIELYGIGIFTLDKDEKVVKVEFFYDPAELLGPLYNSPVSYEDVISSCPVMRNTG